MNWRTPSALEDHEAERILRHHKSSGGGVDFSDKRNELDPITAESEALKIGV
jgi:hypothetical protein